MVTAVTTESVSKYLDKAGTFSLLISVDGRPKAVPLDFHILYLGHLCFGMGTFKNAWKELDANPQAEVLAIADGTFLRYAGRAVRVCDISLMRKAWEAMPEVMAAYARRGWEMGMFRFEDGCVDLQDLCDVQRYFKV